MSQQRVLAAIMFTDIVGYTALSWVMMRKKRLSCSRKTGAFQRPIIEKYNGRWLKEIGDGVLASFTTVSDAVYCAGAIQKACENEPDLKLRIGIHQGEVVFEGDDVFGDGVNIASRLEPLASNGGILVSESVNRNLGNKKGIETTFVREEALKNVKDPVRIYEVKVTSPPDSGSVIPSHPAVQHQWYQQKSTWIVAGLMLFFFIVCLLTQPSPENTSEKPPTTTSKSIAVLPFKNLSTDQENQYFADGVMEAILNHLSKTKELRVISRTSMDHYRGTTKSAPQIAEELKVTNILEGSVQRYENKVRITAQLIQTPSDKHIWSQIYDRDLEDIFSVQSEIAVKIAQELEVKLNPKEEQEIESLGTSNIEAYDLFLRATYENKKFNQESFYKSIELLEESLKIDPQFYQTYTLLAWNYLLLGSIYGDLHPSEAMKYALPAIKKSLEIKPDFSDSYLILGGIQYLLEWHFEEAEKNFKKAMELEFNNLGTTYYCFCLYNIFLIQSGRFEEALNLIVQIKKVDPSYTFLHADLGNIFFLRNQKEKAIEALEEAVSYNDASIEHLSRVYLHFGDFKDVVLALEPWLNKKKIKPPLDLAFLALAHYHLMEKEESEIIINKLMERKSDGDKEVNYALAYFYAGIGKNNMALKWLEEAYQSHDLELLWVYVDPQFNNLRNDIRFQDLLKRVGFDVSG